MPGYLIIDGYNAIHKIKELDAKKEKSLEAGRLCFIRMLLDFISLKKMFDKIYVVFDSKEQALGVRSRSYGAIEALYATLDKDADGVIVDILRKAGARDRITVCSDDNFVRNHARAYARDVISVDKLKNIIMLKKKSFKSKIREKEIDSDIAKGINKELRERWGIDEQP